MAGGDKTTKPVNAALLNRSVSQFGVSRSRNALIQSLALVHQYISDLRWHSVVDA
jgi:hypothetical protein